MAGKKKADMACMWGCGNRVPKAATGRKCGPCVVFMKRYFAAKVLKDPRRQGDERYANLKAGRVALYAALASAKLPLFDGVVAGVAGGGHAT